MDWIDAVPFFSSEKFAEIARDLAVIRKAGFNVLPAKQNILKAFDATPFDKVKVVIIGQDPYPNAEHAMGLAFSVPKGVRPLPKTLVNIFRELGTDLSSIRTDGDLSDWAEQGVLLLNTHLTVLEGDIGSHANMGWTTLTNQAIKAVSEHRTNVVFILWGRHAAPKIHLIDDTKHLSILSAHPSPLAAHKGFYGSKPFSRTNEYLQKYGREPIKWS